MQKYYRNKAEEVTATGAIIDPGSLWKWNDKYQVLVLVDDDEYIETEMSDNFTEVSD